MKPVSELYPDLITDNYILWLCSIFSMHTIVIYEPSNSNILHCVEVLGWLFAGSSRVLPNTPEKAADSSLGKTFTHTML